MPKKTTKKVKAEEVKAPDPEFNELEYIQGQIDDLNGLDEAMKQAGVRNEGQLQAKLSVLRQRKKELDPENASL